MNINRLFRFQNLVSSFRVLRNMSTKTALVFLATGAEEMETCITVDVLRRAGIEVKLAGIHGIEPVVCSRKVKIVPDVDLVSVKNETFDAVIGKFLFFIKLMFYFVLTVVPVFFSTVPGGLGGAENLSKVFCFF